MIQEGMPLPDFKLQDQDGTWRTRADYLGKKAVFYFYPKDDTPGCTVEACNFQERLPTFEGVHVVGVSPDGVKSHRKFADKFSLGFTLLADVDHAFCEAVGVWVEKSMYGRTYMGVDRTTLVIDEQGTVTRVFAKVKPKDHADEVRAAL